MKQVQEAKNWREEEAGDSWKGADKNKNPLLSGI
jgi:hypothetical protein